MLWELAVCFDAEGRLSPMHIFVFSSPILQMSSSIRLLQF